jgi:hypothetical protein
MNTKHPPIDQGCQAQVIKDLAAIPPDGGGAVLAHTFVIEPVHLSDLSRLVVPSNQGDPIGIPDFEGQQE